MHQVSHISKQWSMFTCISFFRTPGRISCSETECCRVAFNSFKCDTLMAPSEFMKWIYSSWPENMQDHLMPRDMVFLTSYCTGHCSVISFYLFIYSNQITYRWVIPSPSTLCILQNILDWKGICSRPQVWMWFRIMNVMNWRWALYL